MSNVVRFPDLPERAPTKTKGPQVEDGYTRIANELLDALCVADFTNREFRVVNFIIRQTYGWGTKQKRLASTFIAGGTGLHATDCSKVLNELIRRQVVVRHGGSRAPVSLNKRHTEWLAAESRKKSAPDSCPQSGQDALTQSGQDDLTKKDRKDINTSPYGEESTAGADDEQTLAVENTKSETLPPAEPKATSLPNCPHQAILDQWAEIMPEKRQPLRSLWTGSSAGSRALAARWKQGFSIINEQTGEALYTDEATGIDWWGRFFKFLRRSEFLMRDDSRFFGLDWIVKAENFRKIMEFKYHPELTGGDA